MQIWLVQIAVWGADVIFRVATNQSACSIMARAHLHILTGSLIFFFLLINLKNPDLIICI